MVKKLILKYLDGGENTNSTPVPQSNDKDKKPFKMPWNQIGQGALIGLNLANSLIPSNTEASTGDSVVNGIADTMSMIPGWGAIAGPALKVGLKVANAIGGSQSINFLKDNATWAAAGNSYGSAEALANDAQSRSGKKYGIFNRGKAREDNAKIIKAQELQAKVAGIMDATKQQNELAAGMLSINLSTYQQQINGGIDYSTMQAARKGAKLFPQSHLDRIKKKKESIRLEEISGFKEGGNIEFQFNTSFYNEDIQAFKEGGKMNVIPEGALHARLHHMEDETPELKGLITEKGIPVIVEKEGGEVELQAEIEHSEIIFIKEVTEKLEKLYKEYYNDETSQSRKDELSILAGKLLAKLIMENTDDRTNLIENIK